MWCTWCKSQSYEWSSAGISVGMFSQCIHLWWCSYLCAGIPGEPLLVTSEQDVFDYVGMDYKEPHERNMWRITDCVPPRASFVAMLHTSLTADCVSQAYWPAVAFCIHSSVLHLFICCRRFCRHHFKMFVAHHWPAAQCQFEYSYFRLKLHTVYT